MSSKTLIIPAAGSGSRMQRQQAKPFITLNGQPVLAHTLRCFLSVDGLSKIVVATSEANIKATEKILRQTVGVDISWECVPGGRERQHSVQKALQVVTGSDLVIVHDAVRPLVRRQQIMECCEAAEKMGAAVLGIPSRNTIKRIDETLHVESTPDRTSMWQIQTPQVFKTALLKKAYARAAEKNYSGTDDASLVEWLGEPVRVVEGRVDNIKITYPVDLKLARILMKEGGQV